MKMIGIQGIIYIYIYIYISPVSVQKTMDIVYSYIEYKRDFMLFYVSVRCMAIII